MTTDPAPVRTEPNAARSRHATRAAAAVLLIAPVLRWLIANHTVAYGTPWRTRCDHCAQLLQLLGCGPAGRCSGCGQRMGAPPYVVEAVALVAVVALVAAGYRGWDLAAHGWWTAGLLVLAATDATVRRLPYRVTAATTAGTVLLLAAAHPPARTWAIALLTTAGLTAFHASISALVRSRLGNGDTAFVVPVALGLAPHGWTALLLAAALAHAVTAVAAAIRRARHQPPAGHPFGTYLAATAILLAVLGAPG
jgi:leader peptidase (prepilin peptidase)/N-methyltransferase